MAISKRTTALGAALAAFALVASAAIARDTTEQDRVQDSIEALHALTGASDDAIPEYVLERADAIVVIPSLIKGGLGFGAEHGKGIMSVRDTRTGRWSAPAFVSMTGGSFGAQIGLESTDLVLVVTNPDGIDELLKDKFTLGADVSVAAGPVGRAADAKTDALMTAKILAYSRTKGLFAGAALDGTAITSDEDANQHFYGVRYGTKDIVLEHDLSASRIPGIVSKWRETLAQVTSDKASH
jgi:lipid-binding SYLF domain-containing protein